MFHSRLRSLKVKSIVNLSFNLTHINPDGTQTTRHKLTAEERLALQYAKDNNILIVASTDNEGNLLSAFGQASTEFDLQFEQWLKKSKICKG